MLPVSISTKLHTPTDKHVGETVSYIGARFRLNNLVQDMYALYWFNDKSENTTNQYRSYIEPF